MPLRKFFISSATHTFEGNYAPWEVLHFFSHSYVLEGILRPLEVLHFFSHANVFEGNYAHWEVLHFLSHAYIFEGNYAPWEVLQPRLRILTLQGFVLEITSVVKTRRGFTS